MAHAEPELPSLELAAAYAEASDELWASRCDRCEGSGWVGPEMCGACRGTGDIPTDKDWAEVGVIDQGAVTALREGWYRPEDLSSRDPNLRLGAHSAAGTMLLDGQLLSSALVLHRHNQAVADDRRCYQQRPKILVDHRPVRWSSLSAEQQREHIAGYAAGVAGEPLATGASPLFASGHRQARQTERTARLVDNGSLGTVQVVSASGSVTTVSQVARMDEISNYYTGFMAPTPLRPYEQKAMFARDAIVGPVPADEPPGG